MMMPGDEPNLRGGEHSIDCVPQPVDDAAVPRGEVAMLVAAEDPLDVLELRARGRQGGELIPASWSLGSASLMTWLTCIEPLSRITTRCPWRVGRAWSTRNRSGVVRERTAAWSRIARSR